MVSGFWFSGFWPLWFLASGFRCLVFVVSGFWFLVSGFWFLVVGVWFLVSGFWRLWCLVSGVGLCLVSDFLLVAPVVSGFWIQLE